MITGVTSSNKESNNMESNLNSNQDWIQSTKTNTKTTKECNSYHRHKLNNSKKCKKIISMMRKKNSRTQYKIQRESAHDIQNRKTSSKPIINIL